VAEHARKAVAPLAVGGPPGTAFPRLTLGICLIAAVAAYAYAWTESGHPDSSFVVNLLVPSMNLVVSPFIALFALLTAKAKRSVRGGAGGGSLEAQDGFRAALVRLTSWAALLICACSTYLSVEINRVGLSAVDPLIMVGVAAAFVLFFVIGLIRVVRVYGQGGALVEHGSAEAPLTDGLADNAHWIWGLFFVDRDDPSILVEKRFGFGYTFNYGNPTAILIVAGFVLLSFALLVVGLYRG
jgi:uncharacterized membrane protein